MQHSSCRSVSPWQKSHWDPSIVIQLNACHPSPNGQWGPRSQPTSPGLRSEERLCLGNITSQGSNFHDLKPHIFLHAIFVASADNNGKWYWRLIKFKGARLVVGGFEVLHHFLLLFSTISWPWCTLAFFSGNWCYCIAAICTPKKLYRCIMILGKKKISL